MELSKPSYPVKHSFLHPSLLILIPFLVAVLLYVPTLQLPLVYDTLLHTQLADGLTWQTIWLPSEQFGFYRPLVFAPLLLIEQLFGGYPAWLLHGLNIAQHALNALLLAWLVYLWTKTKRGQGVLGLVSGLLLATFPFAYQAVISYGNNAYLTATGLVLLGLLVHEWVQHPWRRLALVSFIFIIGVLVHETAVLLIPVIFLKQIVQGAGFREQGAGNKGRPYFAPWTLYHATLASLLAVYLLVYFSLDTGGGPLLDYGGNDPWVKFLLLAQTASWPFAWLAHWFPDVSAQTVVLLSTAVTLGLTLFVLLRQPTYRPLLLLGWGWWLGASLLIALTLPTYYIADGARLLYPGAPGLALAWGGIILGLGQAVGAKTKPRFALVVTGILLALLLWQGATFVRGMIHVYELASAPTTAVVDFFAHEHPPGPDDHTVVLVNWPQWVSPPRNTFPLGTEFAPVLGDHLFAHELLRVNVGEERRVHNLNVPDLLRQTPYNYGVYQFTAVDQIPTGDASQQHVFITDYSDTSPVGRHTGDILAIPAPDTVFARLGPWLLHTRQACWQGEEMVNTSLLLSLPDPSALPPTASFFVQLLAPDGRLLAQADGPALGVAPERWSDLGNVVLDDRRELILPEGDVPATVLIGVYDYVSGERLPVFVEGENTAVSNNALQIPVALCD
jgi:hypothetical protein